MEREKLENRMLAIYVDLHEHVTSVVSPSGRAALKEGAVGAVGEQSPQESSLKEGAM
jgi:hypothetical protein